MTMVNGELQPSGGPSFHGPTWCLRGPTPYYTKIRKYPTQYKTQIDGIIENLGTNPFVFHLAPTVKRPTLSESGGGGGGGGGCDGGILQNQQGWCQVLPQAFSGGKPCCLRSWRRWRRRRDGFETPE